MHFSLDLLYLEFEFYLYLSVCFIIVVIMATGFNYFS